MGRRWLSKRFRQLTMCRKCIKLEHWSQATFRQYTFGGLSVRLWDTVIGSGHILSFHQSSRTQWLQYCENLLLCWSEALDFSHCRILVWGFGCVSKCLLHFKPRIWADGNGGMKVIWVHILSSKLFFFSVKLEPGERFFFFFLGSCTVVDLRGLSMNFYCKSLKLIV